MIPEILYPNFNSQEFNFVPWRTFVPQRTFDAQMTFHLFPEHYYLEGFCSPDFCSSDFCPPESNIKKANSVQFVLLPYYAAYGLVFFQITQPDHVCLKHALLVR